MHHGITLPPLSPGRGGLPKSTPPAHLWNRVRAVALKPPLQVVTRKPGSCVSSHTRRNQVSVTLHTQTPPPAITGQAFTGPGPGPCVPHRCPTTGYVGGSVGAAGTVSRSLASAPQSVSVAPTDHQTRLCDSVRPASPQVQGHPVHFSQTHRCSCLACGNRSPTGEGRDRAGPSSRYEVGVVQPLLHCAQERWWVTTDLGSASLNRALHKLPFKMLTQKRIFGCVRPLDWFAAIDLKDAYFHVSILPRHRPFLRFAFEGQAYQYKVLPFGLSLSPRVFTKVVEAALVPLREQGVRILNYLDDWAHTRTVSQAVVCTQGPGAQAPSACWAFGSTGKRANSCQRRGSLFSAWSSIRSTKQHASPRNVLSQC